MPNNYQSFRQQVQARIREQTNLTLEAIGLFVEGDAKLRTPVDTGNLRGSIDHKVNSDTVTIGTNVEYATYVEKGTSKQQAQPYLTPAAEDNVDRIRAIAERYMREVDSND